MRAIALVLLIAAPVAAQDEIPPYEIKDANAGAAPIDSDRIFAQFGGKPGVERIAADAVDRSIADPRISDIFKAHDIPRLKRLLAEQVCYLLNGGCAYTGRDMRAAHKDMGLRTADLNALVEHVQAAMSAANVPFRAQNRLLAKLAPMRRDVVKR